MSIVDKIASKVMPPESAEDRAEARRKAEALAKDCPFLADVLDHHRQIEQAFVAGLSANDAAARTAAVKRLAAILGAHANAEEAVLYPAMADNHEKGHAAMAYEEQAMTKIQLAKLEMIEPMSQEWRDKLEHIQGAVAHHMYEEEGTWFPQLIEQIPQAQHQHVIKRFREEFGRYSGGGAGAMPASEPADARELA
jgi:iron-sulfur cluster repair protein YtfE (RIC family)